MRGWLLRKPQKFKCPVQRLKARWLSAARAICKILSKQYFEIALIRLRAINQDAPKLDRSGT